MSRSGDPGFRDREDGFESEAELTDGVTVLCPYCGQPVDVFVDLGGGVLQEYVEDCAICCRPWAIRVAFAHDGRPTVTATILDDE
jgi:hypothetical protein